MKNFRTALTGASLVLVIVVAVFGGGIADRLFGIRPLDYIFPRSAPSDTGFQAITERQVIKEESLVIEAIKKASPAVVTISVQTPKRKVLQFNPFGGLDVREQGGGQQDLATGFIVSADGLLVTNKHVVSNSEYKYIVIDKDGKEYEVKNIYRDPANDLALLKIDASGLPIVELGDSENLQVGQTVVAIGTPLGEFRQSATSGIISGLGRGIDAGNPFEGYVERLDNIIQTDAAINPGNSGGPLLNSSGEVIGVNTAVSSEGQNIGFALPINTVKEALDEFNKTGKFSRPFLGVRYKIITRDLALLNDVPEGAYVQDVIDGSPADEGGVQTEDIITKIDGIKVTDKDGGLAKAISGKKVGDRVALEIWRDTETKNITVTLSENTGNN